MYFSASTRVHQRNSCNHNLRAHQHFHTCIYTSTRAHQHFHTCIYIYKSTSAQFMQS